MCTAMQAVNANRQATPAISIWRSPEARRCAALTGSRLILIMLCSARRSCELVSRRPQREPDRDGRLAAMVVQEDRIRLSLRDVHAAEGIHQFDGSVRARLDRSVELGDFGATTR